MVIQYRRQKWKKCKNNKETKANTERQMRALAYNSSVLISNFFAKSYATKRNSILLNLHTSRSQSDMCCFHVHSDQRNTARPDNSYQSISFSLQEFTNSKTSEEIAAGELCTGNPNKKN